MATEALGRVLSGEPAERVLDRTLRAHRHFSREQRQALAEAVFNVGLWRRRLAFHLGTPEAPAPGLLQAFLQLLAGLPATEAARLAGLSTPLPLLQDEPPSLALRFSFPDWLAEHFTRELGPAAEELCAHLNVPGPITLRANLLRTSREALAERLCSEGVETRPGTLSPLALHIEGPKPNLYGLASYQEGLFEVQDEGSQLLGLLVEARPGETVLDLCAGAGGKTLLLGAALRNQGRLMAYDPDAGRLDRLRQRCTRAGVSNIHVLQAPPVALDADRVLVDAPCSELGSLRRGPDMRFRIPPETLTSLPRVQLDILRRAGALVRPGGRLVYATCTLNRAENEQVVEHFLQEASEYQRMVPGAGWLEPACVREGFLFCAPHLHGTDGFFAAVLERRG